MEISEAWTAPVPMPEAWSQYEWDVEPARHEMTGTVDKVPGRRYWLWYGVTKD